MIYNFDFRDESIYYSSRKKKIWNGSLTEASDQPKDVAGQVSMWPGDIENFNLKLTILRISRIHKIKGM